MAFVIQTAMFKHRISQFNHVSGSFRYPIFTDEKAAFSGIIAIHAISALFSTLHSPDFRTSWGVTGLSSKLRLNLLLDGKQGLRSEGKGSICWPILLLIV